jgi:hypothetical protein
MVAGSSGWVICRCAVMAFFLVQVFRSKGNMCPVPDGAEGKNKAQGLRPNARQAGRAENKREQASRTASIAAIIVKILACGWKKPSMKRERCGNESYPRHCGVWQKLGGHALIRFSGGVRHIPSAAPRSDTGSATRAKERELCYAVEMAASREKSLAPATSFIERACNTE